MFGGLFGGGSKASASTNVTTNVDVNVENVIDTSGFEKFADAFTQGALGLVATQQVIAKANLRAQKDIAAAQIATDVAIAGKQQDSLQKYASLVTVAGGLYAIFRILK